MLKEFLESLDFTPGEIKVFEYLNTSNEQSVKQISINSKLSLSKTYEILEKLESKKILSHIFKNNIKYYCLLPLDSLNLILEKKEKETQSQRENLNQIIKNNKNKIIEMKKNTEIRFFSGYNGIKTFYLELQRKNSNDDYLGFMLDQEILKNKTILRLIDNFHKVRSENNKVSKIIIEENTNYNSIRLKKNNFDSYIFKSTNLPFPKNLSVIGNKIIHYNIIPKEEKYEIIEITSNSLSKIYFELFYSIWNN